MRQWLASLAERRPGHPLRILDVGCGRGDVVFWLLEQGWDAWGIDVDPRYIDIGRDYLKHTGHDPGRLRTIDGPRYPLDSDWFQVVISDQVIEHVADLDGLASEVSRVSGPGALGLHIFPARWRPVEVHMHTPLVHWLPKGSARRRALTALLMTRASAAYFTDRPVAERAEIFARFSNDETFYRPPRVIAEAMLRHGIRAELANTARSKVRHHAPWLPAAAVPLAGWVYRNAFSVCMETVQLWPAPDRQARPG